MSLLLLAGIVAVVLGILGIAKVGVTLIIASIALLVMGLLAIVYSRGWVRL